MFTTLAHERANVEPERAKTIESRTRGPKISGFHHVTGERHVKDDRYPKQRKNCNERRERGS
eukprot:4738585-Prorocentrum_lima.AAC.1